MPVWINIRIGLVAHDNSMATIAIFKFCLFICLLQQFNHRPGFLGPVNFQVGGFFEYDF